MLCRIMSPFDVPRLDFTSVLLVVLTPPRRAPSFRVSTGTGVRRKDRERTTLSITRESGGLGWILSKVQGLS